MKLSRSSSPVLAFLYLNRRAARMPTVRCQGRSPRRRFGGLWGLVALGLWAGVFGAACAPATYQHNYAGEPDLKGTPYLVGPADILAIHVWKEPELSGEVTVRTDGKVTIPLVGDLSVEGKSTDLIQQDIIRALKPFLDASKSVVTVEVAVPNSYVFTVNGNVTKPGRYTAGAYLSLMEAVALAGEPTPYASADKLVVLRNASGGRRSIPINYESLLEAKHLEQNITILPGDIIVVP